MPPSEQAARLLVVEQAERARDLHARLALDGARSLDRARQQALVGPADGDDDAELGRARGLRAPGGLDHAVDVEPGGAHRASESAPTASRSAQSSLQPPVLAETIDSTETSGPQWASRTRWASAHNSGTRSGGSSAMRRASSRASGSPRHEHLLLECLQIDHAETIAGAGQPSGSCGTVPSSGAMRCNSAMFVRSATSGSALVPHTTTPATAMPRAARDLDGQRRVVERAEARAARRSAAAVRAPGRGRRTSRAR